jgi:hypothetical protein
MPLSDTQLSDFRADIGDQSDTPAFTDDEIQRLFERTGGYNAAIVLAYEQLLANAVKFVNYTAGRTRVQKEQIYQHLERQLERMKKKGLAPRQVGLNPVRPRREDVPHTVVDYDRHRRGRKW